MLPIIFMVIMGLAMLTYVVLDGYDLGVGLLMPRATLAQKDTMIASIGPFWDANETWLVLGVGLLLIAFPKAHGMVLGALYLPVAFMLIGLILRGVAFDFRVKAQDNHKRAWNRAFAAGSAIASVSQGWMLGRYVTGLQDGWLFDAFAAAIAVALPAAYALLGACWLILKTEGELQERAIGWARKAWPLVVLGIAAISIATPIVSATVRERWFQMPEFIALLVLVFVLGFFGLAYSLYPFVVMDQLTIWQAASSPAALKVILIGVAVAVPAIAAYTVLAYRIFGGKATALRYA